VVAEQHPAWGAALAEEQGVSPLAVKLIRLHQENSIEELTENEKELLAALHRVDDQN
jgi:predicted hydrolase (HD superfamily)